MMKCDHQHDHNDDRDDEMWSRYFLAWAEIFSLCSWFQLHYKYNVDHGVNVFILGCDDCDDNLDNHDNQELRQLQCNDDGEKDD